MLDVSSRWSTTAARRSTNYQRKRGEGKRHHQALIALVRRRINVLHAILRTRQPYRADHTNIPAGQGWPDERPAVVAAAG